MKSRNIGNKASAALLAVPLAACMMLTGCGGDAKPSASPSSTATSSPSTSSPSSSSPSTTAPTTTPTAAPTSTASPVTDPNIPAAARAHTDAGAEAFVRYFYGRLNVAWTAPKAGILAPLCQPTSKACAALERDAVRLVKEGHRYDGDPVTITFIGVLELDNPNPKQIDVLANVVQERRSEIDGAGKTIITDKRKALHIHFVLLYTDHSWSVVTSKIMR